MKCRRAEMGACLVSNPSDWRNRIGDWMQTYTGIQFFPLDPKSAEISILDIAHALSNQCRFAGHVQSFYSVAQHSVLVSEHIERLAMERALHTGLSPRILALWGLLHDAPEAYLVDLPRPIKHCSTIGTEYRQVERRLMEVVCLRFGLPYAEPLEVKAADDVLLMTEKRDLLGPSPQTWRECAEPQAEKIVPWVPVAAERAFLARFNLLMGNGA